MESKTQSLKVAVVGFILAVAAMLPGISGATMAVIFGIYERLVRDLANLRVWLRKDARFIVLLVVGAAVGTVLSAKLLNTFLNDYPAECLMLFAGLVLGQIPAVASTTGVREDRHVTGPQCAAMIAGLAIMAVMIAVELMNITDSEVSVSRDAGGFVLMFIVGIIVAISALLPGLSHSTVLIVCGLFGTFTAAISDFDAFFLTAMVLGVIAGALLFAKILHRLLEDHHRVMMFFILGLTVGSLVSILVTASGNFGDAVHVAASVATFVVGVAVAMIFTRMKIADDMSSE